MLRKVGRWFNPVTLMLAAFCFVFPFVTVSCDTPGGYAGASAGGSSTYNGVALVVGGQPEVDAEHQRPVPVGEDDRLPPQPALAAALLAILAAAGCVVIGRARNRRAAVVVLAAAAGAGLLVGQVLAQAELRVRVADHLTRMAQSGQAIDPNKTTNDYVHTGPGLVLCLALLVIVASANAIGWWRLRPVPALAAHAPPPATDPWGTPL